MISPQQLANLVKAYQARQAEQAQAANVAQLDVRDRASADVSKAA